MTVGIYVVKPTRHDIIAGCSHVFQSSGKTRYTEERTRFMATVGVMSCAYDACRVVGALSTELWQSTDSLAWNKHLPVDRQIQTDPPAMLAGDLAVLCEFRRKGIAKELVKRALDDSKYGEEMSLFSRVFAVSRVPPGEPSGTSYGLLVRLGFVELARLANYYYDPGWRCPDCGDTCSCDGRLMLWERA
jgi:ribosomal protein S18 acetylase RimI-like enzyme